MEIKKSWKKTIQDYNVPTIFKEKLLKPYFFKLNLKEPILDAGSGTGYFSEMFASKGLKVVGIDQNKSQLKNPKAKYFVRDISKTKFKEQSFNSILLINVLSCIDREKERVSILSELRRILKKEGRIYVINTSENLFKKEINSDIFSFSYLGNKKVHIKLEKVNNTHIEFDDYIISDNEMKKYITKSKLKLIKTVIFRNKVPRLEVQKLFILKK